MGIPLTAAGGGTRGGVCRRGLGVVGAGGGLRVVRQWSGPRGGRGGMVWWWYCCRRGGRQWVLCWMGVWASRWVVWVLRVRVVRFSRFLVGRGVEVGAGCLGIQVGLWSVGSGRLLVDGARWHGLQVGGLPVVVGCSL